MTRLSRRNLGKWAGAIVFAATTWHPDSTAEGREAPWSLIAPYRVGASLGFGWRVANLLPAEDGAAILLLLHQASARAARIDIHLRAGAARGIACTRSLDLVLMNGATGRTPSEELLGRALRAFAARVDAEPEALGDELSSLTPHDGRTKLERLAVQALSENIG